MSTILAPVVAGRPRPVLIMTAILAGLQVVTGSAALADLIGDRAFGIIVLAIAAVQVGWGVYVQGVVTPLSDPVDSDGVRLIRGPE